MQPSKVRLCFALLVSFFEILLFSGVIFGFSVFQKVLTDDGLFGNLCSENDTAQNSTEMYMYTACAAQNNQLSLIFTISLLFLPFGTLLAGSLMDKFGIRPVKFILAVFFVCGCLSLAFASPNYEILVYTGFFSFATASISLLMTNLPQSRHFPRISYLITTLLTGASNASAVTVSVIYEFISMGFSRQNVMIVYSILGTTFILISALLQKNTNTTPKTIPIDITCTENKVSSPETSKEAEEGSNSFAYNKQETHWKKLRRQILTTDFMLMAFWFSVHSLRFNFFIGSHNIYLQILGFSDSEISSYTRLLYYCLLSALAFSALPGLIMDLQRRCFHNIQISESKKSRLTTVVPLLLTIIFDIFSCLVVYFQLYIVLAYFSVSLLKPFIYAVLGAFVQAVFEKSNFGTLYGIIICLGSTVQLIQFPLTTWMNETKDAQTVSLILIGLAGLTSVHPIVLLVSTLRKNT